MKARLMTKLALAVVVACAAVGAEAGAKIHWKITGVPFRDGNTYNHTAYLFVNSDASGSYYKGASLAGVLDALKGGGSSFSSYFDTYGFAKSQDRNSSGPLSWDVYSQGYYTSTGFSVFAVILDALNPTYAENYMVVNANTQDYYRTGSLADTEDKTSTTLDWGSQANNSWLSIASIPEPTSGVLFLVGVAALALKRKKAA